MNDIQPIQGCSLADCHTGALYLSIHYTADPAKRDPLWITAEKAAMGDVREWEREMEMSEDVYDGEPVFRDFDPKKHLPRSWREHSAPLVPKSRYWGSHPSISPGIASGKTGHLILWRIIPPPLP